MRLDFEFYDNSLTDTNESTKRLVHEIGRSAVGSLWQTYLQAGHSYRFDGLKSLLASVTNIHCNYFEENDWPNSQLMAEGEGDWKDYLSVLKE